MGHSTAKDNNKWRLSGQAAIIFLEALLFMPVPGNGQEGGLPLTHFSESRMAEDQNWAICQDSYNIMLFANRRGVVTFDGYNWNLIRLPVIPYTMISDIRSQRVFIGGEDSYGYLSRNSKGIYEYTPIVADSSFTGIVTGIILTDSLLYVMSAGCIAIHNLADLEPVSLIGCDADESFTSIFEAKGKIYISLWSEGLCRLEGDSIVPLLTAYMTAWDEILFVLPYNDNRVLIGLGSNSMHLFDGLEFYSWEPVDEGYVGQNLLAGGYCLNDTLYMFSTYEGGVVVAGRQSRRVYHIINYESGLPDNEVYAIGSDNSSGVWISHEYGLTRADLGLPVRNFSIYPGLKGNLISSLWYNDKLYAATSDGLYILTEVRKYDTAEVLRRVANTRRRGSVTAAGQATGEPPAREAGDTGADSIRERRNIFNVIFGKRLTAETAATAEQVSPVPMPEQQRPKPQPQPEYSYVMRSVTRLRSIHHEIRKVQGIDD
ncbi:MAG: hypothetical protein RBS37_09980, partial [Bacteroidales bacterium]|nr:hypothetical protein [Bacteroidales bacterium]